VNAVGAEVHLDVLIGDGERAESVSIDQVDQRRELRIFAKARVLQQPVFVPADEAGDPAGAAIRLQQEDLRQRTGDAQFLSVERMVVVHCVESEVGLANAP